TALQNWINNNHRGVLEHATGSGKTFTSLCAIRYSISKRKSVAAGIACGQKRMGEDGSQRAALGALKRKSPPPSPPRSEAWK
ncbi:MAG: DEAD/DEAH box helicase family protein, partial [Lachnospiraceae bacterium]|nr:DEAD/DEAH box helicase family protein [Lachnospiraceae bacterium]